MLIKRFRVFGWVVVLMCCYQGYPRCYAIWIRLQEISGWLGGDYRYEFEKTDWESGDDGDLRKGRFLSEALHFQVKGSVYHPKLIEFDLGGTLSFQQNNYDYESPPATLSEEEHIRINRSFMDYDADILFFKDRPVSFNLFKIFRNALVDRQLRESFELDHSSQGVKFRVRTIPWMTRGSFAIDENKGLRFGDVIDETYHLFNVNSQAQLGERWNLEFNYDYSRYDETTFNRRLTVHNGLFTGTTYLSDDLMDVATLMLRYYDQTGSYDADHFSADGQVVFNVNPTMTVQSWATVVRESFEGIDNRRQAYSVAVKQEISEYLALLFMPEYTEDTFDDSTRETWGGEGRCLYRREGETVSVSLDTGYRFEHTSSDSGTGIDYVLNETHRFGMDDRIELDSPDVLVNTIVVKDETGVFIYEENRDYRVENVAGRTFLIRISTGLIPPQAVIMVDYQYRLASDVSFDTHMVHIHADTALGRHLNCYYMLNRSDTGRFEISGETWTTIETFTEHILGSEAHWTYFDIRGEYHRKTSNLYPMSGYSMVSRVTFPEFHHVNIFLESGFQRFRYPRAKDTIRSIYAHVRSSVNPSSMLKFAASGYWRDDEGNHNDLQSLEISGEAMFQFRAMTLEMEYFYRNIHDNGVITGDHIVQVKLRRWF